MKAGMEMGKRTERHYSSGNGKYSSERNGKVQRSYLYENLMIFSDFFFLNRSGKWNQDVNETK